jgi:hypothetical protein
MASQISIEFQHLFLYEPTHRVLICRPYKMAVGKERIKRHLQERHTMTLNERKTLVTTLTLLLIIEKKEGFPQPDHHSEPIRGLDIHDAFKCNECNFISRNQVTIRRHKHPESNPSSLDSNSSQRWQSVKVQQWVATGKCASYWIVKSEMDVKLYQISLEMERKMRIVAWMDRHGKIVWSEWRGQGCSNKTEIECR